MDWHIALGIFVGALVILLLLQVEDALWGAAIAGVVAVAMLLARAFLRVARRGPTA